MNLNRNPSIIILIVVLVMFNISIADVPMTISYQGGLNDNSGEPLADGPQLIKFIIWNHATNSSPANEIWNSGFKIVQLTDATFNYDLGSNVAFPDDIFTDTARYLGVTIGTDAEMTPRTRLTNQPFSFHSLRADSAAYAATAEHAYTADNAAYATYAPNAGHATTSDNTANATTADNADNASTLNNQTPSYYLNWSNLNSIPAGFADGIDNVGGSGDITSVNPGSGLTGGGTSGAVTLSIGSNAITSTHIGTAAVGSAEVLDNSISSVDLAPNSVGASELAINSIYSNDIVDGTITANDLAPNSVGTSEIIDNSLTSNDLATNSVGSSEITANAVGSSEIASSAVGTSEVLNNSLTNVDLLDEPGVAQAARTSAITITSGTQTLGTSYINCPTSGYLMVIASMDVSYSHVYGSQSAFAVYLTHSGSSVNQYHHFSSIPSSPTGIVQSIISVNHIYQVSAGNNSASLRGWVLSGVSPDLTIQDITLSVVFFPTAYGTVTN